MPLESCKLLANLRLCGMERRSSNLVARKKLWTGRTKETNPIDFYLLGGLFFITATLPAPPPLAGD